MLGASWGWVVDCVLVEGLGAEVKKRSLGGVAAAGWETPILISSIFFVFFALRWNSIFRLSSFDGINVSPPYVKILMSVRQINTIVKRAREKRILFAMILMVHFIVPAFLDEN